jgi:hypothetical protein
VANQLKTDSMNEGLNPLFDTTLKYEQEQVERAALGIPPNVKKRPEDLF